MPHAPRAASRPAGPTPDPAPPAPDDPTAASILEHYRQCAVSRACSRLLRKEVLGGKAAFGVAGDGKELPQVALATQFEPGDWRAGYYRDQTLMMALGLCGVEDLFAQLYADTAADPFSGGRQMNAHFATPNVDEEGNWLALAERLNVSADVSSTAGQMGRGLGLAFASKKFRELGAELDGGEREPDAPLSHAGREVCWVTIGDASTSEGVFWETLNAAGVMQVPLVVSVWDDGYGISVPVEYQTTKSSISAAVAGLQRRADGGGADGPSGIEIVAVDGYDYLGLLAAYERAARLARKDHVPVLVHVRNLTQQLGHSTSGSHERYKPEERLAFERDFDCNVRFRQWIEEEGYATPEELDAVEEAAAQEARAGQRAAWRRVRARHDATLARARAVLAEAGAGPDALRGERFATLAPALKALRRRALELRAAGEPVPASLTALASELEGAGDDAYHANLTLDGPRGALAVEPVAAVFAEDAPLVPGYKLLNGYFDELLARDGRVLAFGEDVGQIGDVNQGFAGLQGKYGEGRVFDVGIREWTIVGQAIGLALRGLRPIAEIQYLDYLVYALAPLTDDLATLLYRTDGRQRAPAIIRTRGHRLEGIWHSGSPMQMMLGALRGMHLCVPRDMLQAAGMYNALLRADEPAVVVEVLNGYRLRERLPENLAAYTVPLGRPEVLARGTDLTLVTYGACVKVCRDALDLLAGHDVSVELVDVQTLLPFDVEHVIGASVERTNRLLVVDEDVPGGASAFILRHVLDEQGAFRHLDAPPRTLTAAAHRPPYGQDGDYFTKPNAERVAMAVLEIASL